MTCSFYYSMQFFSFSLRKLQNRKFLGQKTPAVSLFIVQIHRPTFHHAQSAPKQFYTCTFCRFLRNANIIPCNELKTLKNLPTFPLCTLAWLSFKKHENCSYHFAFAMVLQSSPIWCARKKSIFRNKMGNPMSVYVMKRNSFLMGNP